MLEGDHLPRPRGMTYGNTTSPGGLPMATYVVRGDHL